MKIIDIYTKYNADFSTEILYSYIDDSGNHSFSKISADNFPYTVYLIPNKKRYSYIYKLNDIIKTQLPIYKIEAPYKIYTQLKTIKKKINSSDAKSADVIINKYMLQEMKKAERKKLLKITEYIFDKKEKKLIGLEIPPEDFIKKINFYNYFLANDFQLDIKFPFLMKKQLAKFNDIKIGFIDIEVITDGVFPNEEEAKYPITSIALIIYKPGENSYKVYSLNYLDKNYTEVSLEYAKSSLEKIKSNFLYLEEYQEILNAYPALKDMFEDFQYKVYTSEKEMLKEFANILNKENVNLMTGWNSISFDMKYIFFRSLNLAVENVIDKIFIDPSFIKEEIKKTKEKQIFKASTTEFYIPGIPHIDMKSVFESSFLKIQYSSYKLDYVAKEVLKLKSGKIYIPDLNKAYRNKNSFELFLKYNLLDAILVLAIELKMFMIKTLFTIREMVGHFSFYNLSINNVLEAYLNVYSMKNKVFFISSVEAEKLNKEVFDIYCKVNSYKKSFLEILGKVL